MEIRIDAPTQARPRLEGSMRRYHPGQPHLDAVGSYVTRMEVECLDSVLGERYEVVEGHG